MTTKPPYTVTIGGRQHHVVHTTKDVWVEREPSGRHRIHLGRVLIDGPLPSYWDDDARPCSRCKLPSHWTTKPRGTLRGRAVHPMCENTLDVLPDHLARQVEFGAAVDLGATAISSTGHAA